MSGEERWIIVPHWNRFQHYTDRNPPWIKAYTELLHNDDWLALTDAQRGVLLTIWLEYAASSGVAKVSKIARSVLSKNLQRNLEALNHAGFIQLSASKPLALARSRETETEKRRIKNERSRAETTRAKTGAGEHRINAAAYSKHEHEPLPEGFDSAQLKRVEAYALELAQRASKRARGDH